MLKVVVMMMMMMLSLKSDCQWDRMASLQCRHHLLLVNMVENLKNKQKISHYNLNSAVTSHYTKPDKIFINQATYDYLGVFLC